MAVDDSSLLPKAPPPRPARRDAAIGAALRRFDGTKEPAAAASPASAKWAWGRRPQFGLAMSMAVVAVIGLPAALVAIRNADVAPPQEAPPAPQRPANRAADASPAAQAASPEPEAPGNPVARGTIARPEPDRFRALADDVTESADYASPAVAAASPPSPPAVAPPPPPPPAPLPSAPEREAVAESDEGSIVVTGTQIQAQNAWAERIRDGRGKATSVNRKSENKGSAPDWVLADLGYRRFLTQLQTAVRANDRSAVAGLISYPLRVNFAGQAKYYRNARLVLADYERIFTPRVRSAVLAQRFEDLFGRDQGVMVGDGAVWFDHICRNSSCSPPGPVRIRAINP